MTPRFGTLTRILSAVFVIAGVGAAIAASSSGHQIGPGRWNDTILVCLAIGYLIVGVGLLIERVWAWWLGTAVAAFTVVMSVALRSPDEGWVLWLVFLALFAVTAAQGRRDRVAPPGGP